MRTDLPTGEARALLDVLRSSTGRLLRAVEAAPVEELLRPSALPGWDRITILAHLRFVAAASSRMTEVALRGEGDPAMYPGGRSTRPATLQLRPGESPSELLASLGAETEALHDTWAALDAEAWSTTLDEPDLGRISLSRLLVLRLTEVEVHGVDLALPGLERWSDAFVRAALPLRVAWLPRLRERSDADLDVSGTWRLRSPSGDWLVTATGTDTEVRPATGDEHPAAAALIDDSDAELLALLLGRGGAGDDAVRFKRAFPGP